MDKRILEELCEFTTDPDNDTVITQVKLKHTPKECEDCGLIGVNRILQIRHLQYPINHWRRYCELCKRYQNPQTGVYDIKTPAEYTSIKKQLLK